MGALWMPDVSIQITSTHDGRFHLNPTTAENQQFTLEAIFDSKTFDEKTLRQPLWMKDNRRLSYLDEWPGSEAVTVWTYDSATRTRTPVFDPTSLVLEGSGEPFKVVSYHWSPDEMHLLFTEKPPAQFKPIGNLFLYDLPGNKLRKLTNTDLPQRNAKFSPDGSTVGVVRADNLWLIDLKTGSERQLTFDGSPTVYNGRLGWVYEEELGLSDGWAWSPDGVTIAYLQQDETNVPEVLLPQYDDLHSAPRRTRYPKAGDPNPTIRLGFLNIATERTVWADLASDEEFYIAQMQWTANDGLLIQRLNRAQDRVDILLVDPAAGQVRTVLTEQSGAWVEAWSWLHFVQGTQQFIWPSERSGYRHLYLYDLSGECIRQVTFGDWEVSEIAGLNSSKRTLFFMAARPAPTERHIYSVSLDGGEPVCLSEGTPGWNRGWTSPDGALLLHTHSNLNHPPTVTLRESGGAVIETLVERNKAMFSGYALQPWEVMTFTTSDNETLTARMLKPSNFDETRRYPALMYAYGGPGSQVAANAWGGKGQLWYQLLADEGYLIFMVDNRGTGGRGAAFKQKTFLNLGYWETHDQLEGAKYLASLPYVDAARIGIWGWSYGGYMASMCMLKGAGAFAAGIAVAPVTDWALYDSIYTERYMRRPVDNPEGYRDSAPVRYADKLEGRFLLIHGLMDDNVHFQNSARLASALQDAKKPFETMFYPGKHHGIEDRHYHLYSLMTDFLKRSL
jgi:dipeptidyl-peptidase-4